MSTSSSLRNISQLTRQTTALVLAAGQGRHLQPLTYRRTKAALPFGGKFRLIDFALSNCLNSGITMVGVGTQYKSRQLSYHVQKTWGHLQGQFGYFVSLLPAEQGHSDKTSGWYRGTGDTLYHNLPFLRESACEYVLILYGDHVYKMDYGPMLAAHVESGADITVGMVPLSSYPSERYGVLQVGADERIEKMHLDDVSPEDRMKATHASMGVFVIRRDLLDDLLLGDQKDLESTHSFRTSILKWAVDNINVHGFSYGSERAEYQSWRPIHNIDEYYAANMDLVRVNPLLDLYDSRWPIWAYQEPAPGAKLIFDDGERGTGCALNSIVSAGVVISGAQVRNSMLFTYVHAEQHSQISDSLLLHGVKVGKNCRIQKAIIGEECVLADGMEIGVDLEADRRRYHVTDSGLVVVTRRMLDQL